jgi:hypothetical protein
MSLSSSWLTFIEVERRSVPARVGYKTNDITGITIMINTMIQRQLLVPKGFEHMTGIKCTVFRLRQDIYQFEVNIPRLSI